MPITALARRRPRAFASTNAYHPSFAPAGIEMVSTLNNAAAIRARLRALADPKVAAGATRFFKTGAGEYGHGDRFLGVSVPTQRRLAREFRGAGAPTAFALLRSPYHEQRHLALLLLVALFERADDALRRTIYDGYLGLVPSRINNWDLVDVSAPTIVGGYLAPRSHWPLYRLARSRSLWKRRVAIIATFHFIKQGSFDDTLAIAELLLDDREDLIHKATGWMLREVGNRDGASLRQFLRKHVTAMPRTTLRYAIEKLPAAERHAYLTTTAASRSVRR